MVSIAFTRRWIRLAAAFLLAAALAIPLLTAAAPARAAASLPCDIYAAGGTPCEAAYSTTRALYGSYDGPLYQVQRASDGKHPEHRPGVGRRGRQLGAAGVVLLRDDLHHHLALRPDPQR
jgi:hypothetical protein